MTDAPAIPGQRTHLSDETNMAQRQPFWGLHWGKVEHHRAYPG